MQPDLTPFHLDLTFMAPLSEERAAKLIDFVSANLIGTVIDVGCGWAELLIRILQVTPNARGVGIDLQESSITHALTLARERGIDDRITLIAGDARDHLPASSDAAVCIGASQIWGPPVEAKVQLDYRSALGGGQSYPENWFSCDIRRGNLDCHANAGSHRSAGRSPR
jgi:SAM-dependent methyltransferase